MNTPTSLVSRALVALAALASSVLIPSFAHAGGLYLFDRGARALSRGGAFVAGADDPASLWYNPAGLSWSKNQVLSDAVLTVMVNTSFTRINTVDGNDYQYPTVKPKPLPLPIPTLAFSHKFGLRDWTFGGGIFAPNTIIMGWPQSVKVEGRNDPAPTRYSLVNLRGSILANLAFGAAWMPIDGLSIGADAQLVLGRFQARQVISACDKVVCAQPEDPAYDANATASLISAAVTGAFGITYDAKLLRLGASVTLPFKFKGKADLDLDLPTAGIFAGASLAGTKKAQMGVNFPLIVRFGSELRPIKAIRMEGAFVLEKWSTQKSIDIEPDNLQIQNVTGIGSYDVGRVSIQRKMRDTWSLRGGSELFIPRRWSPWSLKWVLRGGIAYEKGAFGSQAISPLTLDSDKFILSGGFGVNLVKWLRFDTVLGYMFMKDMKVRDNEIRQPQALRPSKEEYGSVLGNGNYKMDALYLGGAFVLDIN
jgi:long-chain fatty acid transport protein